MISVKEAVETILASVEGEILESYVNINNCYGRILTKNIHANCNLPPFRASIKDGYAVLASDGKGIRKVLGGVIAGNMVSSNIINAFNNVQYCSYKEHFF